MADLETIVADFRARRLKLPALFDALDERGAVSDEVHAAELEWLRQQGIEGALEERVVRAVAAKLTFLQPAGDDVFHDEDDDDGDVTRIKPLDADDVDATKCDVRADEVGADDAATVMRPSSGTHRPDTITDATSGTASSTSSWRRVAAASAEEHATIGTLLKGRFLLERELGRGGMGVVYLARDERKVEALDRDPYVAVKVLNDEFRRRSDSLIALQREARRSQRLAHDNIVRVYDFDKDNTIVFMTMEYIDGTNLKTLIREHAHGGMSLDKARPLINGMARALGRAHADGVVHSDFKPGNVMVTRDGTPKVFDFGIARAGKVAGDAGGDETVFDAGTLGALTPAYASLEMLRGGDPTPADDVYALGCVAYELLTGRHPYNKAKAEAAFEQQSKPPHVSHLTRRQNQTLAKAVAFRAEDRLTDVQALVDGLRAVGWAERARPVMIYGTVVIAVLVAAGWGYHRYTTSQHVQAVVGRFAADNPKSYADETQAYKALSSLGTDQAQRVVVDHNDVIQAYLLRRLDAYWDPARKRYDYAGVQQVFHIRDKLKLYSPQLQARRQSIEQQRNKLLNTLDTQLSQRIEAGAIFRDQPDNAVDTLETIRAINPDSPLLHNSELELKYDAAIGKTLDAGKLDEAKRKLAVARHLFPDSDHFRKRAAQLATLQQVQAAAVHVQTQDMSVSDAREALHRLLAKPSLSTDWREGLAATMQVLADDDASETSKLLASLPGAIATLAQHADSPSQVQRAADLVALGLTYAPDSKPLLAQRKRLADLQAAHEADLAHERALAEVDSRIQSLKRAAAAHDVDKARRSLARIRALQPDNPVLDSKGPQWLAEAYLGKARSLVEHDKYRLAADTLGKGLKALGGRKDLKQAHARLDFVADAVHARVEPVPQADIDRLKQRLDELRQHDAADLAALQKRLKAQGILPEGTFASLVASLKPRAEQSTSPLSHDTPSTPAIAQPAPAASAEAAPASEVKRVAAHDPCARSGLAGSARTCSDRVGSGHGPALVVIPVKGGAPFAMSRTEITVRQFNHFCRATQQCAVADGPANLPVTDVSMGKAKAYASWLSKVTGYDYHVPEQRQWVHAAGAGGQWRQSPDSNCIPPAGGAGLGGPISARGRQPNPWGLVNVTGNVWEWTTAGGSAVIRGGAYDSYWSQCTVASHRRSDGASQPDVGFRVVREVR